MGLTTGEKVLLPMLVVSVTAMVVSGTWLLVRAIRRRIELMRVRRIWRRLHYGPGGERLPPIARGMCDRCQRAADVVYHLESGRRLCLPCFRKQHTPPDGSSGRR